MKNLHGFVLQLRSSSLTYGYIYREREIEMALFLFVQQITLRGEVREENLEANMEKEQSSMHVSWGKIYFCIDIKQQETCPLTRTLAVTAHMAVAEIPCHALVCFHQRHTEAIYLSCSSGHSLSLSSPLLYLLKFYVVMPLKALAHACFEVLTWNRCWFLRGEKNKKKLIKIELHYN